MAKRITGGFSLVELSIVLVILGLLVGGVVGGQHLIRAAQLRAITSEYEELTNAVQTFMLKYDGLPGDLGNAENIWGSAATCPPPADSVNDDGTCNGNGNGRIGDHNVASEIFEQFTAWQQLAFAGLVPGHYTGSVGTATNYHARIGVNVPVSKVPYSGWVLRYRDHFPAAEVNWFVMNYGNALVFGREGATITVDPALLASEAYAIDAKFDDGFPAKGKIIGRGWNVCADGTSNTDFEANYRLTTETLRCSLSFRDVI